MATPTDSNTSAPSAASYDPSVLRGRDDFFTSVYRFFDGLGKHKAFLWVTLAGVIGIASVAAVMANRHEVQAEAGKNALFLAQKAHDTEMKKIAGVKPPTPVATAGDVKADSKADPKADAKAKEAADKAKAAEDTAANKRLEELSFQRLDVDAKFPDSVAQYKGVIERYSGTRPAFEARMALGDLYFNHGEAAKAIPLYKEAVDHAPGSMEKGLALSAWGYSNENAGKPADALAIFQKALNQGEAGIKGDVLMAIARCQEALHDVASARTTYDQIIQQMTGTEYAKTAESLKAQLQ